MNVELEPLAPEHLEMVRKWRNSDLINSVSLSQASISEEMQRYWFEGIKGNLSQLHWIIKVNDHPAGYASIKRINESSDSCEFASLYLGEERFLNSGAGAIAEFKIIQSIYSRYAHIDRILCEVLDFNKKVIQLHKRFGFILVNSAPGENSPENTSIINLCLYRDKWAENRPWLEKLLIKPVH